MSVLALLSKKSKPLASDDLKPTGWKLPTSPIPGERSEIRDAAGQVIEAEQRLQRAGWREAIIRMGSPKSETFLDGYNRFRARLDREHAHVSELVRRDWFAISLLGTLAGFALGMWLGAGIF